MKRILGAILALAVPAAYADFEAGKKRAEAVCGACHGVNGASVSDTIPNLGGQRAAYIEAQLNAFKSGARKAPNATSPIATMAAIATQLSPADMKDVAEYYSSLPGVDRTAKSAQFPNVAKTNVTFPDDYKQTFVKYHTINFPATKQVRHYFANKAALEAARAGKPIPAGAYLLAEVYSAKLEGDKPVVGADGFFVPEKPLFYTAMATGNGWGQNIPEMLKNGDWNYAIFTLDKQHRPINQAECLGCHKPLDKDSYVFTIKPLAGAK